MPDRPSDRSPDPAGPTPATPAPAAEPGSSATRPPASPRSSRRTVLAAGIPALLAIGAVGVLGSPRPGSLGEVSGDADLASALSPHLAGHRHVAAALLENDAEPRIAGFGADPQREFEIGSVSKTFTAALLMSAVADGTVRLEDTVQDILGKSAKGTAVADRTLAQLASHTAGLPPLPKAAALRNLWTTPLRKNPYAKLSAQDLVDAALAAEPSEPGSFAYSNFSVSLEGQLVAHALGTTWQKALAARIIEPLGLTRTRTPMTPAELGPDAPTGHVADGRSCAAWVQDGIAPAGGVRSTIEDMNVYLRSMIDGSDPGAQGLEPIAPAGEGQQVGVNWFTSTTAKGESVTWHNGMTGGFASFCGWNRDTGRGLVLLTDTAQNVDELAMGVLTGEVAA